ncbi:MAG: hypothetical protein WDA27_02255 [Actinomycetota bacterium]
MKRRGHPVRGFVAGLLTGLFLMVDLMIFKVIAPGTLTVAVIPVALAVLGVLMGVTAPFGKKESATAE